MQRCNRPCANEYWPEICASIHSAVETGIIKIIQDRAQQMERWVEHDYSELSARGNMVSLEALNAIECLPVLGDLDSGDLLGLNDLCSSAIVACVFYFILLYSTGGDYTLRILFHSFGFFISLVNVVEGRL